MTIKINNNILISVLLILFISSPSYSQIVFKSKKLTDKLSGKFVDKATDVMGVDEGIFYRKKFEMENYHYKFQN